MKQLFPLAAILTLAASCVANFGEDTPLPAVSSDERLVTLSLNVPTTPDSRAAVADENAITEIDVLLFDATTDGFRYRAIGSAISTPDNLAPAKKQFSVKLPIGNWRIIVLANARASLTALTSPNVPIASLDETSAWTRTTLLNSLEMKLANSAKWSGNIPMWGYYKSGTNTALNVTATTTDIAQEINLTRAISRVDVAVAAAAQGSFKLKRVYLFNRNRAGTLAPLAGNISANDGYAAAQWASNKATAPHLPAAPNTATGESNGLLYTEIVTNNKIEREIYTFEANAGTSFDTDYTKWLASACLVVGGDYTASDGAVTTDTYYRVDFIAKNALNVDEYIPLLRNHQYIVTIKEVSGHGHATPELAYKMRPVNIKATIVPWDETWVNDILYNGQNYLAVDRGEFTFYRTADTKPVKVITDYLPTGWTIEKPAEYTWITAITPSSYSGSGWTTINVTVSAVPSDSPARQGYFYIVAGNLKKKITVTQLAEGEFSLALSTESLVFYATPDAAAVPVGIFPVPAADGTDYKLTFKAEGNIAWSTPSSFTSLSTTLATLDLKPITITPTGIARGGNVMVTLGNNAGRTVSRLINVTQLGRNREFSPYPNNPYPSAAGQYTLPVLSDWPWRTLTVVDDPAWFQLVDTDMHAADPIIPTTYAFRLSANPAPYKERTALVNVTSSEAAFPANTRITIKQGAVPFLNITGTDGVTPV
ncbi:MAG: FimB/Mfa2 family fimbrial subunit, partial [Odoribacteraceae bacterium]|nr:FimB/Mfa2 family fimbrial subunit [Odoribacteraceae bacterium]